MSYAINPELIFLKWAYKRGALDDDQLHEFHVRRRAEQPDESYLELLVEWEMMTRAEIDALLTPAAVDEGLRQGLIDQKNYDALQQLVE